MLRGMRRVFPLAATLAGCASESPEGLDRAIERSLGGCRSVATWYDEDFEVFGGSEVRYDRNGDEVEVETYGSDRYGARFVRETTYGEPHQVATRHSYTTTESTYADQLETFSWEPGLLVTSEIDTLVDGVNDAITTFTYDDQGHRIASLTTRPSGETESSESSWASTEDGWIVVTTSIGADGVAASVTERLDSRERRLEYSWEQDGGYVYEERYTAYGDLTWAAVGAESSVSPVSTSFAEIAMILDRRGRPTTVSSVSSYTSPDGTIDAEATTSVVWYCR
jgi:hypothetical protein